MCAQAATPPAGGKGQRALGAADGVVRPPGVFASYSGHAIIASELTFHSLFRGSLCERQVGNEYVTWAKGFLPSHLAAIASGGLFFIVANCHIGTDRDAGTDHDANGDTKSNRDARTNINSDTNASADPNCSWDTNVSPRHGEHSDGPCPRSRDP